MARSRGNIWPTDNFINLSVQIGSVELINCRCFKAISKGAQLYALRAIFNADFAQVRRDLSGPPIAEVHTLDGHSIPPIRSIVSIWSRLGGLPAERRASSCAR